MLGVYDLNTEYISGSFEVYPLKKASEICSSYKFFFAKGAQWYEEAER